jgi:Ribosomal protein L30p/L7e
VLNCLCCFVQSRKILQLLRLRQIHNGVFVKVRSVDCCCMVGSLVLPMQECDNLQIL